MWATETVTFTAGSDTATGTSITKNGITVSLSSGVFNRTDNYRCYANASMTISSTVGNMTEIVFTDTSGNPMANFSGDPDVGSWANTSKTKWSGNASEIKFGSTSAQVRLTKIVVTYTPSGGGDTPTLTDNDITITGAPIALAFDLYNKADAQVVSYTTSSTGAVTIEPASSEFFTYTHNAEAKTITVTPTAVTTSAQTITIKQAADDTYKAGTATFTVSVDDSTPFDGAIFDAITDKDENNTSQGAGSITKGNVTFSCTDGILGNGSEYRMYKNSTTTISTTDGSTITQIEFTGVSGYAASNFKKQTGWATSDYDGVWTGEAQSVSFEASGAQVRATVIKVTVSSNSNPSISANKVEITYDATSGEIGYSILNPVPGTSLNATTTADWISDINVTTDKVTFTTTANTGEERTATITLTYSTATKEVTVTQAAAPLVYRTIPDLFEAATSDGANVNVSFGNWVVSGVTTDNKTAYVTDNNGNGFIIYHKENHGFAVNDKLSGTVNETPLKLYNGAAEFTNLTASTSGLTVSKDGEITVITDKTIADLGGANTGAVISLSNLTYDGTNLSDGTNTIKPYNTLYDWSDGTFVSGKTYNVTGVYLQYKSTKEILPRNANDIVEVVVTSGDWIKTDLADLTEDDIFVIVGKVAFNSYAMSNNNGTSAPTAVKVTVSENTLSGEIADNIKWKLSGNATDGYTFYPNGDTESWLYCTSSNNGVKVGTDDANIFTLKNNYLYNTGQERYVGIYNSQDWRCYTTINSNIEGQSFSFYKKKSANVMLSASGYATYCSDKALDFTNIKKQNYRAWYISKVEGTTVTFTEITGTVKAGEGIILYGTPGAKCSLPYAESGEELSNNKLVGTLTPTAITTVEGDYTNFGLSGGEFKKINSGTIPANKAYLPVLTSSLNSEARLTIVFDDGTTGVNDVRGKMNEVGDSIFDLQGRKVSKPTKGLYIMNGKKVFVK